MSNFATEIDTDALAQEFYEKLGVTDADRPLNQNNVRDMSEVVTVLEEMRNRIGPKYDFQLLGNEFHEEYKGNQDALLAKKGSALWADIAKILKL